MSVVCRRFYDLVTHRYIPCEKLWSMEKFVNPTLHNIEMNNPRRKTGFEKNNGKWNKC